MPTGLKRFYGSHHLHFITSSCYQRRPLLHEPNRRDIFLNVLEKVRQSYRFVVVGYVIMPEHFHLLMSEPDRGDPSVVMQVVKQRVTQEVNLQSDQKIAQFWQRRFYDFNTWSREKRSEKLRYMHNNPVKRGLVDDPASWDWSSCRYYKTGESGLVTLNKI